MSRLTDAEIDSAITSAIRAPSVSDEDIDAEISRAAGWTPGQYAGPSALPTYQEPAPSILGAAGQLSGGIGGMAAEMAGRPKPAVVPLGGPPMPAAAQPAMDPSDASWGRRMAAGAIGGVLGAAGKVESSWRNIPAQIGSTLRGETSVWDTFTSGGANLPQPVQPGDTVSPSMIAGMAGAPALASPEVQAEMGQMAAGLDPVSRFVSSLPAFPIQFADPKALAVMIATHKPVAAGLESVPVRAMLGAVEQRFGPNVAAATQSVLSNVASNAAFGAGMGVASGEDREGVLREAALGAVTGLPFAVPGVSRAAREAIAARRMAAGESFRGTLRGIDEPGGAIRTPEPARAVTPESRPEFTNAPEKGRQEEGRPQGLLNEADEVAARVAKNHPGAVLELNDMSKTYDRPTWEVAAVEVKEKGKGQGSALMRDLIAEADKRGVRLVLEPTDELGGDVSRLPAFYERLGFTKSTDPKVSFSYVRDPAPAEVTPPGAIQAKPVEPAPAIEQPGRGASDLSALSYADLKAEAKRLGVLEKGNNSAPALRTRIEAARSRPTTQVQQGGAGPALVGDITKAIGESIDTHEAKVSNLRYGKLGTILFEYDGATYSVPEPNDVMPVGNKGGERWAAWKVVKGEAVKTAPTPAEPAPSPAPRPTEAPTSWKLTEAEKAKSEQIKAKVMRGEDLTPEEEAFSRLMNERFNARANATPDDAAAMSHEDWQKWSGGRDGTPEGAVVTAQVAIRRGDELAVESIKNKIADRLGVPSEEVAADPEALARFEANQQKWRGALEQIEKAQAEAAPPGPAEETKPGAIQAKPVEPAPAIEQPGRGAQRPDVPADQSDLGSWWGGLGVEGRTTLMSQAEGWWDRLPNRDRKAVLSSLGIRKDPTESVVALGLPHAQRVAIEFARRQQRGEVGTVAGALPTRDVLVANRKAAERGTGEPVQFGDRVVLPDGRVGLLKTGNGLGSEQVKVVFDDGSRALVYRDTLRKAPTAETSSDLSALSYADLMAEAKRAGVWDQGAKTRKALESRIQESRAAQSTATAPDTSGAEPATAASSAPESPSTTPAESGPGADTPRPDVSSPDRTAREPWQMTRAEVYGDVGIPAELQEIDRQMEPVMDRILKAKGIDRSNVDAFQRSRVGKRGQDVRDTIEAARREAFYEVDPHARAVRQAVAEGRPVPPEVLADYPDLAPAPRPTPARAGWEASAIDYWRKKQAAGEQVPADILAKYPELGPSTNTPTPAPVEPKPAPEPKTAGPADLGTGAPDAAPKPKPQAKPSKPAAPFTKADLLKRMRAVYERNPLLHGDEIASDQANQAGGFSDGSGFFRFQGPTLPAEVRDYIDGRPWLRTKFRVNDPGGRGQDYLAELGDRYFDELDKLTGRSFEKMIDRLARFDQDPEGQFLAAVYRNLPAGRTPPKAVAAPDDIPTGATFTLNGERFRVVDSDGGYRVLRDGDKYEEVPIDALSQVPMDKGSLKTPKAQKSITPQPEQARDLLGNPIAEPATGRQRDMVFETETRPTDTSGRDATDAKIAEKFSEDDTIDLPFSGVRDLGSPPGAKWSPSNVRRISPEPITGVRPKNLSEITLDLRRDLNAGIRAGKTGKWAGTYFPSSQDVLIKFTGDLDTTAHEIGHRIDDTFGIVKDWAGNKQRSPFDDELMPHFSQYGSTTKTGARSKLSYQRTEGVAEWIRAYVVNPDAAKKAAPKFAAHFEAKVPAEVRARLDDFGRSVREWYGANPVDQALANVRMELQPPGFLQRLAGKLRKPDTGLFQMGIRDRIRTALFDDLRPVWAAIEQARQLKGVDPAKISPLRDAMILGRTWAGVDRKILDILNHGPIDAKGNRVKGIGGVDWLLEPLRGPGATPDQIKSDYRALNAYMISERVMDRLGKMQTAGAELQQINADTVNLLQAWAKEPDPGIKAQIMEDIQKNRKRMNQIRKGPLLGYSGPAGSVDSYIAGKMSRFSGIGGAMRADWEVAREVMADVQKDPARLARIKDAAQRLRSWHDWLLTYARDKGRLTDAQYNAIKSADDAYVSFQRVASLEDDALADLYGTRAGGKSLASVKEISKRIKGGTREIENPYVSLLSNTHRVIKEADRNQVLLGIRRDLTQSRPMHAAKPPVDLSQFGRKVKAGDPDTTRIWVGGEAEYWQFAPQIHAALRKWGEQTPTPTLLMPLRIAASVLRNTVTHAPPFIVRNLIRDPINRAVLSRSGSTPLGQFYFLTPSGASSFNADLSTLRRYGGALFGNYQPSPEYNHRFVADKMAELAGDRSVILSTPAQVMRGVMALSEGSETIGRMAEFRRAFQKAKTALGYSDEEAALWAAYQARDLLDYSRAGKLIRPVSQYIPFLNAAMQGVAKTGARFAEAPAKTTAKWAAYVLLPSLATYTYNVMNGSEDEYRALPAWRRDFFFNFKIGPDSWLVLPKPFEMGVLASGVERAVDLVRGNPEAMRGYAGSVAKGLMPVDESALVGPLRPLVEQVANHDFFRDQSIVPDWEADMDVALREGTQNASRIGQFVQDKIGLDARRVDHLSRAFFGNVGGMAQMASDIGRPDKPGAGRRFAEYTTGILRTGPGAQAVPFQAALDEFRRRGLTNRREYRQMTELARAYYDAPDRTTKDQIAAQIREIGRKVLAAVENLPIKPKTATASR